MGDAGDDGGWDDDDDDGCRIVVLAKSGTNVPLRGEGGGPLLKGQRSRLKVKGQNQKVTVSATGNYNGKY